MSFPIEEKTGDGEHGGASALDKKQPFDVAFAKELAAARELKGSTTSVPATMDGLMAQMRRLLVSR